MEEGDPPKPLGKRGFTGERRKRKFSRHLKNGQNKKDSLTERQYNKAAATGPSIPVLQHPEITLSAVHSSAAARKRSKSELE
jgi:hypothetical protein